MPPPEGGSGNASKFNENVNFMKLRRSEVLRVACCVCVLRVACACACCVLRVACCVCVLRVRVACAARCVLRLLRVLRVPLLLCIFFFGSGLVVLLFPGII